MKTFDSDIGSQNNLQKIDGSMNSMGGMTIDNNVNLWNISNFVYPPNFSNFTDFSF